MILPRTGQRRLRKAHDRFTGTAPMKKACDGQGSKPAAARTTPERNDNG